jgi:hypothetical protein
MQTFELVEGEADRGRREDDDDKEDPEDMTEEQKGDRRGG